MMVAQMVLQRKPNKPTKSKLVVVADVHVRIMRAPHWRLGRTRQLKFVLRKTSCFTSRASSDILCCDHSDRKSKLGASGCANSTKLNWDIIIESANDTRDNKYVYLKHQAKATFSPSRMQTRQMTFAQSLRLIYQLTFRMYFCCWSCRSFPSSLLYTDPAVNLLGWC